jgi:uncharacterized membrane protein
MKVIPHYKHATNITQPERWLSGFFGGMAIVTGLQKRGASRLLITAAGADLVRRALSGHSLVYEWLGIRTAPKGQGEETTSVPYELGVRVDESVTINWPRTEMYRFWRRLENVEQFMDAVDSVVQLDCCTSRWTVKGPAGRRIRWDAVIHNELENELIAWRTLPGADVDHAGTVRFQDAPNGGTEVVVELQYNPPAGTLGAAVSKLWGAEPGMLIRQGLQRLKQLLEDPEFKDQVQRDQEIDEASEMSFPASDAPAYNP